LRNARRSRGVLPPGGRCGGSHKAFDDRPRLSVGRLGVMAAAAPTARASPIGAPGSERCARSVVAWLATRGYDVTSSIFIVRGDDHSTAVFAGIGHVTQLRIDRNGQWRRWQHRPVTTRTGDYWITQDDLHRVSPDTLRRLPSFPTKLRAGIF
jgi:hypothetical protein